MTVRALYAAASQLHEDPRLVARATTPSGRVALWLVATLLLLPTSAAWLVPPLLALVLLAPDARTLILALASPLILYALLAGRGAGGGESIAAELLLLVTLLYLCFRAARSYRSLPAGVQHNGQVVLHLLLWVALLATWLLPPLFGVSGELNDGRAMRYVLVFLVWRCGYMLLSGRRGTAAKSSFADHLVYCLPAWGGTQVPYGKGYDHLMRHRAAAAEALARTQLAGIKLLLLALLWSAARRLLDAAVHGEPGFAPLDFLVPYGLGIPRLRVLIAAGPTTMPLAWSGVIIELIQATLELAITGHVIVGCLRLFGYAVFRNTYRPLLAQSIVDFWNRFYYYFKELLVEFFFLPTYVAYFKTRPRLRVVAATMAAACVGNVYYHALRDIDELVRAGPAGAWQLLSPRIFYAVLLGAGLSISMLREQRRRGTLAAVAAVRPWRSARRIAGVWLFYGLIHIWSVEPVALTFAQRTAFFLSLFGVR